MCNHTLEYHHTSCQLREMDGAAVVSDLVCTMRLSDFLCGACLASLNLARGGTRLPQTKTPPPFLSLPSVLLRRLPPFSRCDWGDKH